jgi:hypothetical protein
MNCAGRSGGAGIPRWAPPLARSRRLSYAPRMRILLGNFAGIVGLALLGLCSLCCAVAAQTCEKDVQHLNLPERASIDDVAGLSGPPLEFLFSKDGVEVYSATDFYAMREFRRGSISFANAFTVLLVYQTEEIRQKKIESLRKQYPYAHLSNLKYATWRFELTPMWVDNVLVRKWLVTGMAYFEPISCDGPKAGNSDATQTYLAASINYKNRIVDQMPPLALPENQRSPPTPNSVLARALEEMQKKLQFYDLPT